MPSPRQRTQGSEFCPLGHLRDHRHSHLPTDNVLRNDNLSAHDIRHAAVTHAQEVSQNIAGAAYMAGHKRTATTAAYTHPNYAAGLAMRDSVF
ncbi:MAG: site-specific integrase [Deltaproteobacteria bacterium]|nr:site-specific integrase [Deltaproteobacteria bacterium]